MSAAVLLRRLTRAAGLAAGLLVVLGVVGQAVRDRSVALGLLMYGPTLPAGLVAAAADLSLRGRAFGKGGRPFRFGLTALGASGAAVAALPMLAWGGKPAGAGDLVVLQWNVMWGGGPSRNPETWRAQRRAIRESGAGLVVLSEAPPADWLAELSDELGDAWGSAEAEGEADWPHWFHVAVHARGPVARERLLRLPGGSAATFTAAPDGRALRLLVADGVSDPLSPRGPFLEGLARLCREAADEGRPFDLVLGDFNSPARCLGFDALADEGYRLASRTGAPGPQWRGTFPSFFPLLDIDHVWLAGGWEPRSCRLFLAPWSDHRAQLVRFAALKRADGP